MARPEPGLDLRLSILDRLIDREPRVSTESESPRSQPLAQLKDAVKRNLEWLLNSKQLIANRPADLRQLSTSMLTFGLPDFASSSLNSPQDQDRLRRTVEEAVARFEPRLSRVKITIMEGREHERSLRFRIDAMLNVEPSPEPVTFDSVLELSTRAFMVQGE